MVFARAQKIYKGGGSAEFDAQGNLAITPASGKVARVAGRLVMAGGPHLDIRAYGAFGDGASHTLTALGYATLGAAQVDYPSATALSDEADACALQQLLKDMAARKMPGYVSDGVYLVNKTIVVGGPGFTAAAAYGVSGLRLRGAGSQQYSDGMAGTTFEWNGDATSPLFKLQDVGGSTFEDFNVKGLAATPLAYAFWTENYGYWDGAAVQSGTVTATKCQWNRVNIIGVNGYIGVGWYAPAATTIDAGHPTGSLDANNDFHVFRDCTLSDYSLAGWIINHSQAKAWQMYGCWARGKQSTARCIVGAGYAWNGTAETFSNGGSFQWYGGGGAGHSGPLGAAATGNPADFIVGGGSTDHVVIQGANLEKSYRLLYVAGLANLPVTAILIGVRWAHAGYAVSDGSYIRHYSDGPLVMLSCHIEDYYGSGTFATDGGGGRNMRIESGNAGGSSRAPVVAIGNYIETLDTNRVANLPNGAFLPTAIGNIGKNVGGGGSTVFTYPNVVAQGPLPAAKAADYAAAWYDGGGVIVMNSAAAQRTFTLPTAVGLAGMRFTVKRSGANTVVIATTSSQTIDGAAASTFNLATDMAKLTIVSDGSNWLTV